MHKRPHAVSSIKQVFLVFALLLATMSSIVTFANTDASEIEGLTIRMRYASENGAINVVSDSAFQIRSGNFSQDFAAGRWRFEASNIHPAKQRFHVFPKTFKPSQLAEMDEYVTGWRAKGYDPKTEIFGKELKTRSGRIIDNRLFWVSLARFSAQAEAESLIAKLAKEEVWAWFRPETIEAGTAEIRILDGEMRPVGRLNTPLSIEGTGPFRFAEVDNGFWRESRADRAYLGPLALEIGPEREVEIVGALPVEEYLRGVVPAEMPVSWPAEALKAQAVAARSEVLANLAGKHRMEGFDFCALEHCRAFKGQDGHDPATDAAILGTAGELLVAGGVVVPTVFSASCGGWTEDNENVWSGPVNPALRGIADFPANLRPALPASQGMGRWLASTSGAYCSSDTANYRWVKRLSSQELSALVNKQYRVGTVISIEALERGVSGRLKAVRVVGTGKSEIIRKELNIRLAFGGLPSALFAVEKENADFIFRGAGRGHGVGMCQQGARGMAVKGNGYHAILTHYFSGVQLERLN